MQNHKYDYREMLKVILVMFIQQMLMKLLGQSKNLPMLKIICIILFSKEQIIIQKNIISFIKRCMIH
jgi:hypothetical protein